MYSKLKALAVFILVTQFHAGALAQQDDDAQEEENSGGVLQRYGRNAASLIESVTVDSSSIPLLRDYSAVTDEVLKNPPDSDWLSWRRTQDNLGFSGS